MELNSRGFFFSLISVMLLIGLFFIAQPRIFESTLVVERTSQERIAFTNSLIQNFEQGYLNRAIESQTFIVLEAIADYREAEGSLYTSREALEADFAEGLINGTFGSGSAYVADHLPPGFDGSQRTLSTLLELYANATGQNNNVRFSFSDDPEDYTVRLFQNEQTGPWQVGVELGIAYNVTPGLPIFSYMGDEIAVWNLNRTITSYSVIRGVRDPFLYVRSEGAIEAPISEFYTERWNRNAFIDFVESKRYYPSNASMSMLGRYYESMEFSTCCGMLTTIDTTRYDAYNSTRGDEFANITFLDCGYFPTSPVTLSCRQGDNLVYAVVGLSDFTASGPETGGVIIDHSSDFPFTVGGSSGPEIFNLTFSDDLRRVIFEE